MIENVSENSEASTQHPIQQAIVQFYVFSVRFFN